MKFAYQQKEPTHKISNRQEYAISIEYFSSDSPAVRLKGVRDLYKCTKTVCDMETKDEIWQLFRDQVKYFTRDKNYQDRFKDKPSGDIQELIDILTRRGGYREFEASKVFHTDMSGAYLAGANFRDAQLPGADFREAQLPGANFRDAQLSGADFWYAKLHGVRFGSAQLQGADFGSAQLQGSDFWDTKLHGANFGSAQLQGAGFGDAQLQGAGFGDAQLQEADFWNAKLQGADGKSSARIIFKNTLNDKVMKSTNMQSATAKGGLSKEAIEEMEEELDLNAGYWRACNKWGIERLLQDLKDNHRGRAVNGSDEDWLQELTKKGAEIGTYTQYEADKWFEEYSKAMELKEGAY